MLLGFQIHGLFILLYQIRFLMSMERRSPFGSKLGVLRNREIEIIWLASRLFSADCWAHVPPAGANVNAHIFLTHQIMPHDLNFAFFTLFFLNLLVNIKLVICCACFAFFQHSNLRSGLFEKVFSLDLESFSISNIVHI